MYGYLLHAAHIRNQCYDSVHNNLVHSFAVQSSVKNLEPTTSDNDTNFHCITLGTSEHFLYRLLSHVNPELNLRGALQRHKILNTEKP
jgi:hypothetical protein